MNYLWFQLCSNFHTSYNKTQKLKEEYYQQLKDREFEEINNKINILINEKVANSNFPTAKEILEAKEKLPVWWNDYGEIELKPPTPEEQQELDDIIAELTGEKEEDKGMEL